MSKRFTDTNKYKKPFHRGLPGAYKLLWDYLYHDCDHAGIWHVDFEIAQIYIGKDMPVSHDEALRLFNAGEVRVIPFDHGRKWHLPSFILFQYGELNPANRVHASVISAISGIKKEGASEGLTSPMEGCKDKYKDKDTDKDIDALPEKAHTPKKKTSDEITDEWVQSLFDKPAFENKDIWAEYEKCKVWSETNNKAFNRRRFVNWLNNSKDLPKQTHDHYGFPLPSPKQQAEEREWFENFMKEQEAKEKLAREEEERLYGSGEG